MQTTTNRQTPPTQLGNVASSADTFDAPTDSSGNKLLKANDGLWYTADQVLPNGKTVEHAVPAMPVNSNPKAGLIDFEHTPNNNVATTGDLKNLGWIVSTPGNQYTDQIRHTDKIAFNGANGIEITGKTASDGTREITVSLKEGKVSNQITVTDKDGRQTHAVKIGNRYYKAGTDGKPTEETVSIGKDDTVQNDGAGFVTGNAVADAIGESGWNIGLANKAAAEKAFASPEKSLSSEKVEKINPNDNIRFSDGKNTSVKAATLKATDPNGKTVSNTYIRFDVELPVSQIQQNIHRDEEGNVVKQFKGKWYSADQLDENGLLKDPKHAHALSDDATAKISTDNLLSIDPEHRHSPYVSGTQRRNRLNPAQINALKEIQAQAVLSPSAMAAKAEIAKALAGQDAAVIQKAMDAVDNAAKAEAKAKYLADNHLVQGTGGTVISNLGWGKAPGDAVNVDQFQNSGWLLDSHRVEGSNGKVITSNTEASKVRMDETVGINAGNNIEITRNGHDISVATSMNPTFTSIHIGGSDGISLSNEQGSLNVGNAKITHVAPGVISKTSTDAVNGSQLHSAATGINNRIDGLNRHLADSDKRADAGIAGTLAASQLPQSYLPGKGIVAAAVGNYRGQNGIAVGVSKISDNGKIIIRMAGSANTQGKAGLAAGIGYQWN